MAEGDKVREGQVYKYSKDIEYRIDNVRYSTNSCTIFNLETNKVANSTYPISTIESDAKWELYSDVVKICAECNEEKEIDPSDFICEECRKKVMVDGRLVAELRGELLIIGFKGNAEEISLTEYNTGIEILRLQRFDLPVPVLEALRKFVE